EADPDYFGRETGNASLDDPLNADEIGKNEILVVSFGTSFNESRALDIGGIEKAIAAEYTDWSVRRAFTAQIIINHIQARDGEKIDNMDQALARAEANGVENLIVQPTHLMHGAEYDELVAALAPYKSKMNIIVSEPLLGQVGADSSAINADKEAVARAVVLAANVPDDTALVLMGHGTAHAASITYEQMQAQMTELGYNNVFIGTVEGEPASTECSAVIAKVKAANYTKVVLRPLMVVAGDHANNDMADPEDEESWLSQFTASGNFASVDTQISGLGRIPAVQLLYINHIEDALEAAEPALIDISTATVTVTPESVVYDGESHTPTITLAIGDKTLVAEQDYTVGVSVASTSDGTAVGTVKYTIAGVESAGYTGLAHAEFTIKEPVVLEDGTYSLPELKSGSGESFNHMVADSRFLKVEGDTATIIFTQDGSTASVGKYSRLALIKSHDFIPEGSNYVSDDLLPVGTKVVEGTEAGTGDKGTMWHYEITLPKADVEAMLTNGTVLDITLWNNVGSSADKIPGWYRATNDFYLDLGQLGSKTA
ncbi:MAG: sirohydrochlorin cobaltochelatase, partial [Eggerthellaceae bacterium]|nr:sirohydrochlorin cobaltochelatase [Eggerthellaceae bacterium]